MLIFNPTNEEEILVFVSHALYQFDKKTTRFQQPLFTFGVCFCVLSLLDEALLHCYK